MWLAFLNFIITSFVTGSDRDMCVSNLILQFFYIFYCSGRMVVEDQRSMTPQLIK